MPDLSTGHKNQDRYVKVRPVMGRPTRLPRALIARLATWLESGNFVSQATEAESVPRSTFYYWVERGQRDSAMGRASLYRDFLYTRKKGGSPSRKSKRSTVTE